MRPRRLVLAATLSIALAIGLAHEVSAEDLPGTVFMGGGEGRAAGEQYFVDFRARRGALFGHTFIVYGRLGAQGRLLDVAYAGNYPTHNQLGLIVGALIPVRTRIGAVKDDFTDIPTIIYRRRLNAAEFARLKAAVRHIRATEHYWHLGFYNCNDFAVEVASALGLRSPLPWQVPHAFITGLRVLNDP
jgi:hypothetical protein